MELPVRHIVLREEQYNSLEEDVWSQNFVDAQLVEGASRQPIQLRYRGGHSREYPKRSYELRRGSHTIHLNAEYDDPSLIRNALSFQFFRWIGVPCSRTNHCRVFLNGRNLGIYLEIEAVDELFFRRRNIAAGHVLYAVNGKADFSLTDPDTGNKKVSLLKGYDMIIGGQKDRQQFASFILKLNTLTKVQRYKHLSSTLDIENYLRWLAGAVFTGNYDGFHQNYAIYMHKFKHVYRMIPWDYEGTWGRNCYGKRVNSDLVSVSGYNNLTKKLLSFPKIRKRYKQILKEILADTFTSSKISPVMYEMHESIAPYVYRDKARKWSYEVFDNEPQLITNYIEERREIIADAVAEL